VTQYVACRFAESGRTYTYHNDGEPVAVGDKVKVLTQREGQKTVTVAEILTAKPKFDTKPVLGKVVAEEKEKA
jgi:hypothetical protein